MEIVVLGLNDNVPVISLDSCEAGVEVPEDAVEGDQVCTFTVTDADTEQEFNLIRLDRFHDMCRCCT